MFKITPHYSRTASNQFIIIEFILNKSNLSGQVFKHANNLKILITSGWSLSLRMLWCVFHHTTFDFRSCIFLLVETSSFPLSLQFSVWIPAPPTVSNGLLPTGISPEHLITQFEHLRQQSCGCFIFCLNASSATLAVFAQDTFNQKK